MSRKYKFKDQDKPYFVSFSVVYWIDVFTRDIYRDILLDSLRYCQQHKGLEVYAWVIMTNHIHLIIGRKGEGKMQDIIRDMKKYTSVQLLKAIGENPQESRKEWMLWMFERAGKRNPNNQKHQFWQQDNHPIELSNAEIAEQKLTYLHENPVKAGFVSEIEHYLYSSARDYTGQQGLLADVIFLFG
jgi:putative transposase